VASLAGNASLNTTTSVTIPTSGTFYVGAIVDDQDVINEVDENNNTGVLSTGIPSSTLLITNADFVAGLPGTSVSVVTTGGAANVRLAQSPTWTPQPAWNTPTSITSARPWVGDINGDGLPDVFVGYYTNSGSVFLTAYKNVGTTTTPQWTAAPGSWTAITSCDSAGYYAPALIDLNDDGFLDLVVGTRNKVCIYKNAGNATVPSWSRQTGWESGLGSLTTNRFYVPAAADMNGDGRPDLMLGWAGGGVLGYRNDGSSSTPHWTAQASWNTAASLSSTSAALADLNGDGTFDLLVGNNSSGTLLAYQNTGTTSTPSWTPNAAWNVNSGVSTTFGTGSAFGDLDGDGRVDVMVTADPSSNVKAFQNTGPYASSGTYISKVVDAGTHGGYTTLAYTAVIPPGTTLAVDIRAGDTSTPDGSWIPAGGSWLTDIANGGDISALGTKRYVQYRFRFATNDTTVSSALYNIRANTQAPPGTATVVSVVADSSSGGGEMGIIELLTLALLVLFGRRGIRRSGHTVIQREQ
jgi:hypothetical protein